MNTPELPPPPTMPFSRGKPSFAWRLARRVLLALAVLVTLVAAFFAEENWRGKRAWERYRSEQQAEGRVMDWQAYIPPAVPDDQNIFKAPKMAEWFVKRVPGASSSNELTRDISAGISTKPSSLQSGAPNYVLIAELNFQPPGAGSESNRTATVWRLHSAEITQQAEKLARDALGPTAKGCAGTYLFVARPIDEIKTARIVVEGNEPPTADELRKLFPTDSLLAGTSRLRVEPSGNNSFGVWLSPPWAIAAADYVAWSDQCAQDFRLIREGLKRPYSRMDGDYQLPYERPVPNFVTVRVVAQTLGQRAQCYLLLDQPEAAWQELALIHDLCRVMEARPTGKPMTLVAAMIKVAVNGLYTEIVAEGLRLGAWREPQLAAIQRQLKETDMLTDVATAFDSERLAISHTLETLPAGQLVKLFSFGTAKANLWQRIQEPASLLLPAVPRGWLYQNIIACSALDNRAMEAIDVTNRLVRPRLADDSTRAVQMVVGHFSPYTFVARIAIPNFSRATQTLAHNQTLVSEGQVACALERYRLAHGEYPEAPQALVPQFIEALPHEIVNGEPLKYRRTPEGGFLLYSVGWNGIDDGGIAGKTTAEGDWVWGKS